MGNQHGNYRVYRLIIGRYIITNKKYSNEIERQIVDEYLNGASTKYLKDKYNFKTNKSIIDKVKKYGENPRTQREELMLNKTYEEFSMSIIDSWFKAYYLGLIIADGYIVNNVVGIDMVDEDVIQFISNIIDKPYNIIKRKPPRQNKYRITLNSPRLIDEFKRLNIGERKSKTLGAINLYDIEYKYFPYIIRGLIDGDGWIRKDGKEFFICSASLEFIKWLKNKMEEKIYMQDLNIVQQDEINKTTMYQLRSSLKRNINILKVLVYDQPYGMQRKYNLIHDKPSETIMEDTLY